MRTYSAAAVAALDSGRFGRRVLFSVAGLPGGEAGFWDDAYTATIDGVVYYGITNNIRVGALGSGGDNAARAATVEISGLSSEVAALVENESWHQKPVTIREAILDAAGTIVHVETVFSGFLDQMPRRERAGGTSSLQAICESIQRELSRSGARTRSDSDQRQMDASDGFMRHVAASVATDVYWGRLPPTGAAPKTSSGSQFR